MVFHGSSPRGRGKHLRHIMGVWVYGLIPARAGKTTLPGNRRPGQAAHPRAGGENTTNRLPVLPLPGSSPRGRGKLYVHVAAYAREGLIPARAGKTTPPNLT